MLIPYNTNLLCIESDSLKTKIDINRLGYELSTYLDDNRKFLAVGLWKPAWSRHFLKGSAWGVPIQRFELLAQLILNNFLMASIVLFRKEAVQLYGIEDRDNDNIDTHMLWLRLAADDRLSILNWNDFAEFDEIPNPPIKCTEKRLFFLDHLLDNYQDGINIIHRSLCLYPFDNELWMWYEKTIITDNQHLVGETLRKDHQLLKALRSDYNQLDIINEIAREYESENKEVNAYFSRLLSLSINPAQSEIYRLAKRVLQNQYIATPDIQFQSVLQSDIGISVIIATYNRPFTLKVAIKSVLDQTYQNFEILVIDDGSDPAARSIVENFKSNKIRYFYKPNGGHSSAINMGLSLAKGKYISYLDDDDIYYKDHLETLITLAEDKQLDFICSRCRWSQGYWLNDEWIEICDLTPVDNNDRVEYLSKGCSIANLTVLHRREILSQVGYFYETFCCGSDWEFWHRCSQRIKIEMNGEITGEYRVPMVSLPIYRPALARFSIKILEVYMGSEMGLAIMAISAAHLKKIKDWDYFIDPLLNKQLAIRYDQFIELSRLALEIKSPNTKKLVKALSNSDPLAFLQSIFKDGNLFTIISRFVRTPLTAWKRPFYFIIRERSYMFSKIKSFLGLN